MSAAQAQLASLLPLREAAAQFGLGQSTLYRYIRQGHLRRYRRAQRGQTRGRPLTYVDAEEMRSLLEQFAKAQPA